MKPERKDAKTILVVEDDADIGTTLLHMLIEETTYETVLATNPLEALKIVKDLKPILFILNYSLPYMNGIQLYDQLHAQPELQHVHALMVSANLPKNELVARNIRGIEKPMDIDDFLDEVKRLIQA